MQIDVLIIKKRTDDVIHKNIGRIFRKYNIIEYKSPTDYLSIDDFYKVYGYTCFYKSDSKSVDDIKITDVTITFVCKSFPEKLVHHLTKIRGLGIEKMGEGVYYITKDIIPIQLLITSELSEDENLWLRNLTDDIQSVKTVEKLSVEYGVHEQDELYKSMMNIIIRANREKFEEANKMCEALRELFADELESNMNKGIEIGRSEGYEQGQLEGIRCMIESSKECGGSWEKVFELVMEKFSSTNEQAEEYMKLYW